MKECINIRGEGKVKGESDCEKREVARLRRHKA